MESVIFCAIFVPMLCALPAYFIGRKRGNCQELELFAVSASAFAFMCVLPLLYCALTSGDITAALPVCGFGLSFRADGFRCVVSLAASFAWLGASISGVGYYKRGGYENVGRLLCFSLLTLGAVLGVFFSDDFLTLFVFFEIMSFSSYPMVAHDETPEALRAAATYLGISVLGGMSALMGMALLYSHAGTLEFPMLRELFTYFEPDSTVYAACALMLVGFGAKAGIIGLHVWLPKAHPAAPAPMSALLSGVLTKTGVYGILCATSFVIIKSYGWSEALLILGCATMLWGAVTALLSSNIKKALACSSMSQLGFILVGIAVIAAPSSDTFTAAAGVTLHMLNHTLLKLLLFTCAGVIYANTRELELSKLRGWGRNKLLLNLAFLCGSLGISGVPFFNGYASKTLLHNALGELAQEGGIWRTAELAFIIAGGLTAAYMAKLYVTIFVRKPVERTAASEKRGYLGAAGASVLVVCSALTILIGVFPSRVLGLISGFSDFFGASESQCVFFGSEQLLGAASSLIIGAGVYLLLVLPLIRDKNRLPAWFDLENSFYRPAIKLIFAASALISRLMAQSADIVVYFVRKYLMTDLYSGRSGRRLAIRERTEDEEAAEKVRFASVVRLHAAAEHMVTQTFSFGLIAVCIGIVAALAYIVLQFYI